MRRVSLNKALAGSVFPAVLVLACLLPLAAVTAAASPPKKKVLAVMSYHRGNTWQDEEREGVDSVLTGVDVSYFYLDAKRNEAGGPARAARQAAGRTR